jgi:hypothetical protein
MSSILKKVSSATASPEIIANLLEKHIGESRYERHCSEAIESISKIKDKQLNKYIQAYIKMTQPFTSQADKIQCIISILRNYPSN